MTVPFNSKNNNQIAEDYEKIRQRNIASNRSLLLSLNLSAGHNLIPKAISKSKNKINKTTENDDQVNERSKKSSKKVNHTITSDETNQEGRRRSGRILKIQSNSNKSKKDLNSEDEEEEEEGGEYELEEDNSDLDDSDDQENQTSGRGKKRKSVWHPPREPKRARGGEPPKRKAKSLKGSRPNPKIFGHQIGTEVGDWWDSRMMCSQAGVHAPPVSGISGTEEAGCYSVALSGGYEDDVDLGYAFTFTGAGGRALRGTANNPKNLRTAPQSSDQEFTSVNAALRLSCEKRNPVRVIRGYKNHSPFAPEEGYRYDGLYRVEKCWREAGQSGFQVCKFAFVRLPNQPRIPVKEGKEAEAEQMYKDMGFNLEDLAPVSEKRQPWTQSLAKKRLQAQREVDQKFEEGEEDVNLKSDEKGTEKEKEDVNLNSDEKATEEKEEINGDDVKMDVDKLDSNEDEEKSNEVLKKAKIEANEEKLIEVLEEEQIEEKEKNGNSDSRKDLFNSVNDNISKGTEINKLETEVEHQSIDESFKKGDSNQVNLSKQTEEGTKDEPTEQDIQVIPDSNKNEEKLIEVLEEEKTEQKEENNDLNLQTDLLNSVNENISKEASINKLEIKVEQQSIDESLKEDESNQINVKQTEKAAIEGPTEEDIPVITKDFVKTKQSEDEELIVHEVEQDEDDRIVASNLVPVQNE